MLEPEHGRFQQSLNQAHGPNGAPHVLHQDQTSSWPEKASHFGKDRAIIRNRTEHGRGNHAIKRSVSKVEVVGAGAAQFQVLPKRLRARACASESISLLMSTPTSRTSRG
jgi:hypothetical protein